MLIALVLTFSFMLVEVVGGIWSGSLALLADAGHMLADVGALGLAWVAFGLAARPTDSRRTYGYERFEVLAAFVNGLVLAALAVWIVIEGIGRLNSPRDILSTPMLAVAVCGLLVNTVAFRVLHGGERENLNMRAALYHVAGDILGSVAAIIAAVVIMTTGWVAIDPLLSFLVAGLVLWGAVTLVRRSAHILLEGAPPQFDPDDIRNHLLAALPELSDVHHVHVWGLTETRPLVTLHAVIDSNRPAGGGDPVVVLDRIKAELRDHFAITHVTVQVETGPCPDT